MFFYDNWSRLNMPTEESNRCPTCGRPLKNNKGWVGPAVIGALAGLGVGVGFVAYWFGTFAGFFHTMALIHEIAGTLLGILTGLIVWKWRG
jgi:hypothetical protein